MYEHLPSAYQTLLSHQSILTKRQEMWSLLVAGYKLWPAVCLMQHTLIPVERRTLVGSLVGLGWNVYLAIRSST